MYVQKDVVTCPIENNAFTCLVKFTFAILKPNDLIGNKRLKILK